MERIKESYLERVFEYRGIELPDNVKEYIEEWFEDSCELDFNCHVNNDEEVNKDVFEFYTNDITEEMALELGYFKRCYENTDDEYDYIVEMRDAPSTIECEDYIIGEEMNRSLLAVFDGFDEICRRMGKKS
jgi:hypothetical protein